MARDGAGTFELYTPGNPVVSGSTIASTWANNTLSDIAQALTESIATNGESVVLDDIPFNDNKLTEVADATEPQDAANARGVQSGSYNWAGTAGGTVDDIEVGIIPAPDAYSDGLTVEFVASGNNTGAATLKVGSLSAVDLTKSGTSPLVADDITTGQIVRATYTGTGFQIAVAGTAPPGSGQLISVQVITSTQAVPAVGGAATYVCELVGGGGAGGGSPATAALQNSGGGGGGSGAPAEIVLTAADWSTTQTVTIGAGGVAVSGATGGNGGDTTIGSLVTAPGGSGGTTRAAASVNSFRFARGGLGGLVSTGDVPGLGTQGESTILLDNNALNGIGQGGATKYGGGGQLNTANTAGTAGVSYGSGGSGTVNNASQAAVSGGNGAPGVCIIRAYT